MRKRFWFSAKNAHFWHFWFSNFFTAGIKELYIKIHLHTIKIFFCGVYWDARNCQKMAFLNKFSSTLRDFISLPISKISANLKYTKKRLLSNKTREKIFRLASPYCTAHWRKMELVKYNPGWQKCRARTQSSLSFIALSLDLQIRWWYLRKKMSLRISEKNAQFNKALLAANL